MSILVYGKYKTLIDAAWQVLIDHNISELPVSVTSIAASEGISIIKNSQINILEKDESAMSLFDGSNWRIIYNDSEPTARCRFTIAHELGHIFLGHPLKSGIYTRTFEQNKPLIETEADMFAARLLAPACVLWGLNLHTPEEISAVCSISLAAARIRADRMKILYKRNKFLTSPIEKSVYRNFEKYISQKQKQ